MFIQGGDDSETASNPLNAVRMTRDKDYKHITDGFFEASSKFSNLVSNGKYQHQ